jgi:hypothetical protein
MVEFVRPLQRLYYVPFYRVVPSLDSTTSLNIRPGVCVSHDAVHKHISPPQGDTWYHLQNPEDYKTLCDVSNTFYNDGASDVKALVDIFPIARTIALPSPELVLQWNADHKSKCDTHNLKGALCKELTHSMRMLNWSAES